MNDINLSPFLHNRGASFSVKILGLFYGEGMVCTTLDKFSSIEDEPDFKPLEMLGIAYNEDNNLISSIVADSESKNIERTKSKTSVTGSGQTTTRKNEPKIKPVIKTLGLLGTVGSKGKNNVSDTSKVQKALNDVGYTPRLLVDGICGDKTVTAINKYQKTFLKLADGLVDPKGITSQKLASSFKYKPTQRIVHSNPANQSIIIPKNKPISTVGLTKQAWPRDSYKSLTDYFGKPGENFVKLTVAYPLRLAWKTSTVVTTVRCNKGVKHSLERIFHAILKHYGSLEEIQKVGLDLYGGCSNVRKMRGGSKWSRHSWGIAIDLNPSSNGLHTPWPKIATMPVEVIEIFEAEGWKSLGRSWGKDAMHFQATL